MANVEYILNEKNKYITKEFIENTLKQYNTDYKVNDINNFINATVHTSYIEKDEEYWKSHRSAKNASDLKPIENPQDAIPLHKRSYEELELLGDGVIHLILVDYFCERYKGLGEGFITKLRTKIENGETLSHFCKLIGLNQYILISRYIEQNNGRDNNKRILEDVFEAFIGALYRDNINGKNNYDKCRSFIINLLEKEVDLSEMLYVDNNYKDKLLQYFHKMKWCDPIYTKVNTCTTKDNKKIFIVSVTRKKSHKDEGLICGTGKDYSVKKAEQDAAKNALEMLQKNE